MLQLLDVTQRHFRCHIRIMQRLTVIALVASIAAACARSPSTSHPVAPASQPRSSPNVLNENDLAKTEAPNALVVVQQLRPTWLRGRGGSMAANGESVAVVVYVDGARVGTTRELEQIARTSIKEMRYFSPSDATTRWGTGHSLGAIAVVTK
jgi:hypothetical protein